MIRSFINAFRGIFLLIKSERNFQIHLCALIAVVSVGLYLEIHRFEWLILILISALVLGLEALNSALEKICDEVSMERKESIRNIKDIAAGAVLISAIASLIIAVVIFLPYLCK